ncbi:hypothetical protein TNCV_4282101 [Trichonephila clavipes]|nr:hypothetical protein TNCV_4282101 [Trichonephila clavipes]
MHCYRFSAEWGSQENYRLTKGTSFMSALTTEFLERFGVKVVRSSVYHPQSNPVERMHRTLKQDSSCPVSGGNSRLGENSSSSPSLP